MIEHADRRGGYGWIDKAINDTIKTRKKFNTEGRKFIASCDADKHETVFYRNGLRYFIAIDGNPVATGFSATDCAKKAFLDGKIKDETYVLFTRGYNASIEYRKNKNRKEKL